MNAERRRVFILTDVEKRGICLNLKNGVEREGILNVIGITGIRVSLIRSKIKPAFPDVLLICPSLRHEEQSKELRGFVRRIRKHLPNAKIVIHAPEVEEEVKKTINADKWLDERLPHEYLGQELEDI
jgi:hypothetical protein